MKLIFIGFAINKNNANKLNGPSIAGNNMQNGVIKGIYNEIGNDLILITVIPIATYPREKKIYIKKSKEKIDKNINSTIVPFINLPIIKQVTIFINLIREIKKIIKMYKDEEIKLLVFNAVPFVSLPVNIISKLYSYKSICMLADPPVDYIKRNKISKIFRELRDKISAYSINRFDKNIVLNKNAAIDYAPTKPYIVVDCGIDICKNDKIKKKIIKHYQKTGEKRIVFTGTIQEHSGILNLVEAMKYIKYPNVKLYIYGNGPLKDIILEKTKYMNNVIINNFLPHDKIRKIQQEAYLLVNPSKVDHPINRVAFPSKLMEYMISGTPVITNRLEAINDEYNDKIFFFKKDDPREMANDIINLINCEYEVFMRKAEEAERFIVNNKDWNIQGKRICKFILEKN